MIVTARSIGPSERIYRRGRFLWPDPLLLLRIHVNAIEKRSSRHCDGIEWLPMEKEGGYVRTVSVYSTTVCHSQLKDVTAGK